MKIFLCTNDLRDLIGFRGEIIDHFLKSGHDLTVVIPSKERDRLYHHQLPEACSVKFVSMNPNGMNPISDSITFVHYFFMMLRHRPDIVFNYTIKPNVYAGLAAKLCGCKVVCMLAGLGYIFTEGSWLRKLGRKLYKIALHHADKVLVLNRMNYDVLLEKGYAKKDKTILFKEGEGVNLKKYFFSKPKFNDTTFLMSARLLKEKGYYEFVEAAKKVKKIYPEVKFHYLGKTAYDSPMGIPDRVLENDIRNGYINYLGYTNDVTKYISKDVVLTLPSYYPEGLNRSLMEACSMGRPVITTNVDGCKEIVKDGYNGYIVPPHDVDALVQAMIRFIELPREDKIQMALNSRQIAEKEFDIRWVIKHYDNIIKDLC